MVLCSIALICPVVPARSHEQGLVIPAGTEIQLSLRDPLSSKLSEVGDEVVATLRKDLVADGYKLLQQGTEFIGRVTLAQPARRPLKGGQLQVTFDRVRIEGQERKLYSVVKSASNFTRDEKVKGDGEGTLKAGTDGGKVFENVGTAATIGGVGATIIILSSRDSSSARGISTAGAVGGAAVLGGSVAAGILLTKGKEIRLDPETMIRLKLEKQLAVD
ncbi:MAG TPA: hypothetical protein VJ302_29130 [Blastocatellia bacterium]|nr:hypothetical protein [Blastocatellia bacterium]